MFVSTCVFCTCISNCFLRCKALLNVCMIWKRVLYKYGFIIFRILHSFSDKHSLDELLHILFGMFLIVYSEFILVFLCRLLLAYRNTLESFSEVQRVNHSNGPQFFLFIIIYVYIIFKLLYLFHSLLFDKLSI